MPHEITSDPDSVASHATLPRQRQPLDRLTWALLGGGALVALVILVFMFPGYQVNRYVAPIHDLLVAQDFKGLVPCLVGAIKHNRSVTDFTYMLGESYFRTGQYQLAIETYQSAQKLRPSTQALEFTGCCLYELGKQDEAKRYFQQVISKEPKSAASNYYIARTKMMNKSLQPEEYGQIAMELAMASKGSIWEAKAIPLREQLMKTVMGSDVGSATKYLAAITTGTTQTQPVIGMSSATTSTVPIGKP